LQGLRRFKLTTREAHSLCARFSFQPPRQPEVHMERHNPDIYKTAIVVGQSAPQTESKS